jgi:hypothetical protein
MSRLPASFLLLTGLFACCQSTPAEIVTFVLDPARSSITVSGNTVGAPLENQGPGSRITSYTGTIKADVTGSTIQFLTGSSIDASTNGVWAPLANGANGTAPADYAAKAVTGLGTANAALRNIIIDASSQVIPVTGGSFDSGTLIFEFPTNGTASLDYRVSGGIFPVSGSEKLESRATNNITAAATLMDQGGTQTLTLPVQTTFVFDLASSGDTMVTLTGSLVATRSTGPSVVFDAGSLTVTGSTLDLQWQAPAGQNFRIEGSTNLVQWSTRATNITSTGTTYSWSGMATGPNEYFRLAQ